MERVREVLDYWFGAPDSPDYGRRRDVWFKEGRTIDDEVRARFLSLHEEAAAGALDHWREDADACLALIILLDQFPRHMFRSTPRAFATDAKALATAKHAVERGHDRDRMTVELGFIYLPFSHSEALGEQRRGVALREAMPECDDKPGAIRRAREHMAVVERFGRFPHRNDILGRDSTAEEIAFLDADPDAWFMKYRK